MKTLGIRVSDDMIDVLEKISAARKIPVSEIVRECIDKQLNTDLDIQNELMVTLGTFRSELMNVKREVNVFSSLFVYWLRFYFTLSAESFDEIPEGVARHMAFQKGDDRRDKFLAMYKRDNPHLHNLFEQLFADYAIKENEVQDNTQERK
ncbi:MAG: ribbon-helix-helix protein, CopG family [Treponema sp.]|nr:ribbon-helix-helix protein, CopG family [Treponema sp.]